MPERYEYPPVLYNRATMKDKTFTEKVLLCIAVEFALLLFFMLVIFVEAP